MRPGGALLVGLYFEKAVDESNQSLTMKTRWKKKCNRELRVQNTATFLLLL